MLLRTGALPAETVTVVALRLGMEAALGPVAAALLGVATVTVSGPVEVVALGLVAVAVRGPVMVTSLGVGTATGLTTGDAFLPQVLASLATATRGGGMGITLTIRAIPTIPIRTMAIPIMAASTMVTHTTAIRTTKTETLAPPPPERSKPPSHNGAIIAVRLTGFGVRRLAVQSDHSKRIKVCL